MRKREIITTARRKAIDRIVSRILVFALCITMVPAALAINALAFEEPEIVAQKALASVNDDYTPTELVNGDFEKYPDVYPNNIGEIWSKNNNNRTYDPLTITVNANTLIGIANTYAGKTFNGLYIEPLETNWTTTQTATENYPGVNNTRFEWVNAARNDAKNAYGITYSNGYFVEMNAKHNAVFYQDLKTVGNDIIYWELKHGVRKNIAAIEKQQDMQVDIGVPVTENVSVGNSIVEGNTAAFYKWDTDHSVISKTHDGDGTDDNKSFYGYGHNEDLKYLSMNADDFPADNVWRKVNGVYIVPIGQNQTRFAFTSLTPYSSGNFLDDIVFETLLGNVNIYPEQNDDPDNIKVTGYWSLHEENVGASVEYKIYEKGPDGKPVVDNGPVVEGEIDMSRLGQLPNPSNHWSAEIPKDGLAPKDYVIVINHSDYPEAKTYNDFKIETGVTYDANGGAYVDDNGVTHTQRHYFDPYGSNHTVKSFGDVGFKRPGYTFAGWYDNKECNGTECNGTECNGTECNCTKYTAGTDTVPINEGKVLYAKWKAIDYTITYHNDIDDTYIHGFASTPAHSNPHQEISATPITKNVDNHITVATASDVFGALVTPQCGQHGTDSCVFLGWDTMSPAARKAQETPQLPQVIYAANDTFSMPAHNVDLYAVWASPDHTTVIYHKVAAGAELKPGKESPDTSFANDGGSVVVVNGADYFTYEKHKFVAWHEDAPDANGVFPNTPGHVHNKYGNDPDAHEITKACDTNNDGLVNLYAEWQELWQITYHDKYFIDDADSKYLHDVTYVDKNGGNYYESSATSMSKTDAAKHFPKDDHVLLGWATETTYNNNRTYNKSDIDYAPGVSVSLTGDNDLYAVWAPTYDVAFHANGAHETLGYGIPEITDLSDGAAFTVKSNDDAAHYYSHPGYEIVEWNTQPDGSGVSYVPGRVYEIDADEMELKHAGATLQLYAIWAPVHHTTGGSSVTKNTLTYESNGGTKYPTETYPNGTVVDLNKVPAKEGYIFTGWYSDAALTNKITDVTMNGSKTVYAGWKAATVPGMLNDYDHFAYVIGYPDGMVQPNGQITRAEIATIFFRLLKPEVRDGNLTTENPFEDVKQGDWYNKPVSTMVKLGIVNGRTTTTFAPNAPITRAELATICARFDETVVDNGNLTFSDVANHWAYKEIGHAAALGWLMGYPDGTFLPDASITRAETMTLINRVLQRIPETESDLLPDMVKWPDNVSTQWYYLAVQEATNSHDFNHKGEIHETWTELTAVPDWTRYEN